MIKKEREKREPLFQKKVKLYFQLAIGSFKKLTGHHISLALHPVIED